MTGLYIHIPFCLAKCPYCDFYSVRYGRSLAEEYKRAVIRNLGYYRQERFDTVYFGGGTPILLWKEICEILGNIPFADNAEITLEANPGVTFRENLKELKSAGVNRISLGIQSLNDDELKALGRRHNGEAAIKSIETAYSCGFDNISADLMLSTPLQTKESLSRTVSELCKLPVAHISAYMLKIEENTPYAQRELPLPDEDVTCDMYLNTVKQLDGLGYKQYEISSFAKEGFICRHNMKYWNCEEYVGIGPAAHSYYNGERFFVNRDIDGFIRSERQEAVKEDTEGAAFGGFEEYAMLRLRLAEGLNLKEYKRRGGNAKTLLKEAEKIPKGCFNFNGESISLTPSGFLVSNAIIAKLLGY
ncbi:MAG TPA: coproporphyrinogen III oxidase family protein [Ruminococcaceae bacterium]|nr:coproporphyrinogen III oxidase family protein [Oscillospiraceae bacterium]